MLFTQIDNDLRDSGQFVHHYFTLLVVLLHFLESNHQNIVRRNICNTYIPHGKCLKQETCDGGDNITKNLREL